MSLNKKKKEAAIKMLESLPALRRELQKMERSQKLSPQTKIQRYQKKMLQLLIRQKTSILQNQQLTTQLTSVRQRASQAQQLSKAITVRLKQKQGEAQKLGSEIQRLCETIENLQAQNRMNQLGRLNEEEKYWELQQNYKVLQSQKDKLQIKIAELANENIKLKEDNLQNERKTKSQLDQLNQKNNQLSIQIHNIKKQFQAQLTTMNHLMDQKENQISAHNRQLTNLQQKLNLSQSSENALKLQLTQSSQNYSSLQSKLQQLSKQNHLLKLKSKQFQDSLYTHQIEKGQQSLLFEKLEKENKKLKKIISQTEEKLRESQQEKSILEEKYQQLNKNHKNTKKELQKIKDSLSQANDYETGVKSKIDKLQLTLKQCRETLLQKDQNIQSLQETLKTLTNELSTTKTESIQAKFTMEEMKKKYDVVSEARNLAEQKLVLEREENAKSLSSMIKEKEVCYRQNYKLLQLLEVKDKALEKILSGLKNTDDLERQLSLEISGKQNNTKRMIDDILSKEIKGNKDRVKLIDEHIHKNKF